MFNIEAYYAQAHSGENVDNTKMLEYVRSFKKVVLWGGSYLGNAIGKYFLDHDVKLTLIRLSCSPSSCSARIGQDTDVAIEISPKLFFEVNFFIIMLKSGCINGSPPITVTVPMLSIASKNLSISSKILSVGTLILLSIGYSFI